MPYVTVNIFEDLADDDAACELHGVDSSGAVVLRHWWSSGEVEKWSGGVAKVTWLVLAYKCT